MTRKGKFFRNAIILTAGSLILRFINIGFRAYIAQNIGTDGMGMYQLIFSLFMLASTICTSGAGFVVTRLSAEGKGSEETIKKCCCIALLVSLSAAAIFLLGANPMARFLLNSPEHARSLQFLAPGLPFMAICSCLKGWFLARGNSYVPAGAEILEQALTIGASVALLSPLPPMEAFMLGSSLGECGSFAVVGVGWLFCRNRQKRTKASVKESVKTAVPSKEILRIGAPVTCGTFIRSGLNSIENLLIPKGLRMHGENAQGALSGYGLLQGMVMPLLLFPASFAGSLCTLLVPELARAASEKDNQFIKRTAARAMRLTLAFSFFVLAGFLALSDPLCRLFYQNTEAGGFLRIMAPIVPILYLDNVVDGMLKGLDQQMHSFTYNFADSVLRIIFLSILLPLWGIAGYITILFFSEIFNATLSIGRLLKVTRLRPELRKWVVPPAIGALLIYGVLLFFRSI